MREKTRALSLSALCAALSVVLLGLTLLLPMQRLTLLCCASLGVVASLCLNGARWALGTYAVSALLALLLLPEKSAALAYAFFCGYYPVLKLRLEAVRSLVFRYGLKFLCFNAAFALFYAVVKLTVSLSLWTLILGANAAFLVYDYALGKLILLYTRKIAGRIDHG